MTAYPRPTFIYDGDCAFCSSCVRFAERWIPTRARFVPWQFADLAALQLDQEQCEQAVQWVDGLGPPAAGPVAIARLLESSHAGWRAAGQVLQLRPVLAVAWLVYRWVARHRDLMPGGTPTCALPQSQRQPIRPPIE